MTEPAASGPLAHIRVLDLSRMYPGAICTSLLADLGADVVKVEGPGFGDGMRHITPDGAAHTTFNRGKRSVSVDLRNPRGPEVVRRLVGGFDVVVESHRPGALDKLGIGYDDLRADHPGLIWCSITGFGPDGPHANAPGHDVTYLAYSGVLRALAGGGPLPITDVVVAVPMGGIFAAVGILAAVASRAETGVGTRIDASLVDSAMWLLAEQISRAANAPGPHWPPMASRAVYECADGRSVSVAASEARSWAALCEALDLPELADHRHGVDEEEARTTLADRFATMPAAHWFETGGFAAGIAMVNDADDLLTDPHVVAREGLVTLEGGDTVLANPLRLDGASAAASTSATTPPPDLGESTDELLLAAGLDASELASLRSDGALG